MAKKSGESGKGTVRISKQSIAAGSTGGSGKGGTGKGGSGSAGTGNAQQPPETKK